MAITHITGRGQITIPSDLRRKVGLDTGAAVYWEVDDRGLLVGRPVPYTLEDMRGSVVAPPGVPDSIDFDDLIDSAFESGYAEEWAARDSSPVSQ